MISPRSLDQPVISTRPRWVLRVLAWLAFALCAYLAWTAVTGSGPSSACVGGTDCEEVQSSAWSVWLGMPIAVAGLALYSSLAGLSVLTNLSGASARKWIGGLLLFSSLAVALCGIWFTGIQLFALGKFCLACTALHVLGLSIAGVVIWGLHSRPATTSVKPAAGLTATSPRPAAVGVPGVIMPRVVQPVSRGASSSIRGVEWAWAGGAAALLVATLAAGQIYFPADATYQTPVVLQEPVRLGVGDDLQPSPTTEQALTYQANRIPTEISADDGGVSQAGAVATSHPPAEVANSATIDANTASAKVDATAAAKDDPSSAAAAPVQLPRPKRLVKFLDGSVTLDIYQHPHLGNPEAPHVMLEFASYDCPHCHAMHRVLQRALRRYGDQVAIVVLPYPQEMECNKEVKDSKQSITGACAIARMAVGVASLDPAKFAQFHDWLMAGKERSRTPSQIVQQAYALVERDRITTLREQLHKSLAEYVDLYMKIKAKAPDPNKVGLPLMVIGDQILSGELKGDEKLFEAWEQKFGVKPINGLSPADLPAETSLSPDA